ncbi:MAG TPA: TorF family putative porin [Opitutaceae bacterium]|nr:TorF family putative porin [Opitutaceae bacterium]
MKLRTLLILVLTCLTGAAGLLAEDKYSYSATSDFSYVSEYVYRGIKRTSSALQPSVEVDLPNTGQGDLDVGLWASQPLQNKRSPYSTEVEGNEVDVYAGYKVKVDDSLSFEAVTTYYWYPDAKKSITGVPVYQTRDSYEVGLGTTYRIFGLSPSIYYYYDLVRRAQTVEGAVGYNVPLKKLGTALDFNLFAGTQSARDAFPRVPGPAIHESYNYYGAELSVPYQLSEHAKVHAGVAYSGNDKYLVGVPRDHVSVTVGFTAGF